MKHYVNHKWIEFVEEDKHIYDSSRQRVCDIERTDTGVFLVLKCYNSKEYIKYRKVRICLTDLFKDLS